MIKEFVPYEQALELKELGFDEHCFAHFVKHYNEIKCILNSDDFDEWWSNNSDNLEVKAPLYQQAFRWVREKYGYDVSIIRRTINAYKFEINLLFVEDIDYHFIDFSFNTYEEAELECLKKLIEVVKSR